MDMLFCLIINAFLLKFLLFKEKNDINNFMNVYCYLFCLFISIWKFSSSDDVIAHTHCHIFISDDLKYSLKKRDHHRDLFLVDIKKINRNLSF